MDGSSSMRLCSSPGEVFLLLVCESQGKRGCWTVNAKSGWRSRCCLLPWKQTNKQTLFGIPSFDICCERRHPLWLVAQDTTNFSDTWTRAVLWPSPFVSSAVAFRVLTGCLVSFVCSCSSLLVPSLSLSLSIIKVSLALQEEDCIILSTRLPGALGAL